MPKKTIVLKTQRLLLRPFKMEDIPSIIPNLSNIKVSKWLLVVPYPYKKKDAIWFINNNLKKQKEKPITSYAFGIELKEEKQIIGGIGIKIVDAPSKTASVGYWLGENYWRKGYGGEALIAILAFGFKKLKLRRIEACVFKGNPSSGKLLEKFGFKLEGLKRKAVICKADGKIKDEYIYGLLKEEYVGTSKLTKPKK